MSPAMVALFGPLVECAPDAGCSVAFLTTLTDQDLVPRVQELPLQCERGPELPPWLRPTALCAGALSYPLYAIHAPLVLATALVAAHTSSGLGRAILWPTARVSLRLAACALERFYDRPLRNRLTASLSIQATPL